MPPTIDAVVELPSLAVTTIDLVAQPPILVNFSPTEATYHVDLTPPTPITLVQVELPGAIPQIEVVIAQGPVGPPGPPGQGAAVPLNAAEDLPAFAVVSSNGLLADSANPTVHFGRVVGVSVAAAASGTIVTVEVDGELTNPLWNWSPGQKLFLNGKALSPTAPSNGFSQLIAIARNATTIIIDPGLPVLLT